MPAIKTSAKIPAQQRLNVLLKSAAMSPSSLLCCKIKAKKDIV
jgi:hypothetical protein